MIKNTFFEENSPKGVKMRGVFLWLIKRSQQEFDPNNLGSKALQPDKNNKPKETQQAFILSGLREKRGQYPLRVQADEDALASLIPEGITEVSQLPTSIPSYLVSVIPELKVNGITVKTAGAMRLGEEIPLVTGIQLAGRGYARTPRSYSVTAGSYLHVNVFAGSVSPKKLENLQTKLEATKTTLESADQAEIAKLSREDILGDMFFAGGLGYYAQLLSLSYISGLKAKAFYQLAAGYGTIGYEPEVNTFFGMPRGIKTGGVAFDIPLIYVTASSDGDNEKKIQFTKQIGTLSSALEHITPEQMFAPTDPNEPAPDAISAVKALQKASQAGQKIYQINQANMNQVLPLLNHDSATIDEIISAISAGKEVTTHTDVVSIPGGWSGFGYIIIEPSTGDGAYKISGGLNGAIIIFLAALLMVMALFILTAPVGIFLGLTGAALFGVGGGGFIAGLTILSEEGHINPDKILSSLGLLVAFFAAIGGGIATVIAGGILATISFIRAMFSFVFPLNDIKSNLKRYYKIV